VKGSGGDRSYWSSCISTVLQNIRVAPNTDGARQERKSIDGVAGLLLGSGSVALTANLARGASGHASDGAWAEIF
jgi:hypothetical protein